jgi:ferrochelatase
MRYWHPFIQETVEKIIADRIKLLVVLSLYPHYSKATTPHYSKATTGSAIAEFKRVISRFQTPDPELQIKYIDQWYDFPPYIDSLANLMYRGISEFHGRQVHILFSAHNLPEEFIRKGDPYIQHIKSTIEETIKRLSMNPYELTNLNWHLSFQSKSGPVNWLQPSTEETLIRLAREGVKHVFMVPVSFVSDHIETLYEIDIIYRDLSKHLGIHVKRCESLNTSEKFIQALKELAIKNLNFT